MKNRKSLLVILAVLLAGLAGWWYWSEKSSISASGSKSKTSTLIARGTSSQANQSRGGAGVAHDSTSPVIGQSIGVNPANGQPEVKINPALPDADKMQMIFDAQNNELHDYYGKAVDQYGQPVAGAQAIATSVFISGQGTHNEDRFGVTDAQGLFQFTGVPGKSGVGVKKSGYEWSGHSDDPPEGVKSDPDHRSIFTMYKLQGAEPMVHSKIHDYIPCDGTETHYDLATGKKVATGGDLIVKLTRNPVDIDRGKPFDWQVSIEFANGGLLEVTNLYPYEAPAGGYKPIITITQDATAKDWSAAYGGAFYFKSGDGKVYGRMTIHIQADFQPPPTLFNAEIYANPSGSRNLEFDPAKTVKPGSPTSN